MERSNKEVERFYKTKQWQRTRQAYIAYKHGMCERCNNGGYFVHHKIYINSKNINNPDITLNFNNLELLCKKCHNKEHFEEIGYKFDENGELIPPA